jgi:enoyl-CoA hydratase/carnithine racemase
MHNAYMSDDVLYEARGAVAVITLNRPAALNAVTYDMFEQLRERLVEAELTPEIRAVVLTGTGRAFSSGGDLKIPLIEHTERWPDRSYLGLVQRAASLVSFLEWMTTPVICMVNGLAFGVGLAFVLAGDLTIAAEGATFCCPEAARDVVDPYMPRLVWRVGFERAKYMILTGEPIPAADAATWGLITEAVPADQLEERTMKLAELIAGKGPNAVAGYKSMLRRILPEFDLATYFGGAMTDRGTVALQAFVERSADKTERGANKKGRSGGKSAADGHGV